MLILNLLLMVGLLGVFCYLLGLITMPAPFMQIIIVVAVIVAICWVLNVFGIHTPVPGPPVFIGR